MRRLLKPLVCALLRRDVREIQRRAAGFAIRDPAGRTLVAALGEAFLGGYNAMLAASSLDDVARAGGTQAEHYRPFWFEGAAMGYLPRGYHDRTCGPAHAERALLGIDVRHRYLYYVGLGFWYGFRHAQRPSRIEGLAPHLEPLALPLCYDGYGFKLGFFDFPADSRAVARLERCPPHRRRWAYQGFGRAQFFTLMDDEAGFRRLRDGLPGAHAEDVEFGRALALAFTGIDRPARLVEALEHAEERELGARLLGTTWGLTARCTCDADYFERCLAQAGARDRAWLRRLPELCDAVRADALDYADWQARTQRAVLGAWTAR